MQEMGYKISLGLEAAKVPELLGLWLAESLPVDFIVKQRKLQGLRIIEVTITATSMEVLQAKREAFAKVVRGAGFRGVVVKDRKPRKF